MVDNFGSYPLLFAFGFLCSGFSGHGVFAGIVRPMSNESFCNGTGRIITSFGH